MHTAVGRPGVGDARAPVSARAPGRPDRLLALVAEVSLAVQLTTRHRAPRTAAAAALGVGLLTAGTPVGGVRSALVQGLCAAVSAVIGARLLAPGAALHAARYAAVSPANVVLGRALGAALLVLPVGLAILIVTGPPGLWGWHVVAPLLICLATMTLAMALAPALGAFVGGALSALVALAWPLALPVTSAPWVMGGLAAGVVCGALSVAWAVVTRGRPGHRPVR